MFEPQGYRKYNLEADKNWWMHMNYIASYYNDEIKIEYISES